MNSTILMFLVQRKVILEVGEGSVVEMSENSKVITCSNKRLSYCWREISMRRSDEIQYMIMYVGRDKNMLVEGRG